MTDRRAFLRGSLSGTALALGSGVLGLLRPTRVLAEWPAPRFSPRGVDEALADLAGGAPATPSDAIALEVPGKAGDPRTVPVSVEASLPEVTEIWVLVAENAMPVVAGFRLDEGAVPAVSVRTKMARTSDIIAVVRSRGALYTARTRVEVPSGEGCAV
jgi:sulfur-oxidizing protein SoxY